MTNIYRLFDQVDEVCTKYEQNTQLLHDTQASLVVAETHHINAKKALAVIQEAATNVQSQLKGKITNLVNMALRTVFDDPPLFTMEIVSKRNKTECELSLQEGKYPSAPEDGAGGGVLDVVSFALRVVIWTFTTSENTLILDEPFKYLSADRAERASKLLSEVSHKLNLQIIMVSHQEGVNTAAGRTYLVTKKQNKPSVVAIQNN